jgi:plasmid stability protein
MATLYVENVPKDRYEALRGRAKANGRSIAAEVLALLEENVPTEQEWKARQKWIRRLVRMRARRTKSRRSFPTAEEMVREDRKR